MLECTERVDGLMFAVKVVPRASRSRVVGEHDGALRVRVAAPPVDGAANEELVRTLAHALKIPVRHIEITSGHTSKLKQVRVQGVTREALETLARAK